MSNQGYGGGGFGQPPGGGAVVGYPGFILLASLCVSVEAADAGMTLRK